MIDLATLIEIVNAQRTLDRALPVISHREGLLQELQNAFAALGRPENAATAVKVMNALLTLQNLVRHIESTRLTLEA